MSATATVATPPEFRAALNTLSAVRLRPEIEIAELPAPAKLAPWSHALSATVFTAADGTESASGRLILLYDPDGVTAWDGCLRIVIFATAELDPEIASDALLPEVAWSWLTDSLAARSVPHTALGGTVTATSSSRFGDISGPQRTDDLEIRASWTATEADAGVHLAAFSDLLATAAGLPPEGVATLRVR